VGTIVSPCSQRPANCRATKQQPFGRSVVPLPHYYYYFFYTPGSKGSRGLKTKVKNKAGMAIGPVDPWKTSRAKAPS